MKVKDILEEIKDYNDNDLISVDNPPIFYCENEFENDEMSFNFADRKEDYEGKIVNYYHLIGYKSRKNMGVE